MAADRVPAFGRRGVASSPFGRTCGPVGAGGDAGLISSDDHANPEYVVVAAALIRRTQPPAVLAAQRAYPPSLAGQWELPGGKVEPDESDVAALVRECREELGITIDVDDQLGFDVATVDGRGVLRTYLATARDEPQALEHKAIRWLTSGELDSVEWLEADLPVVERLRGLLIPNHPTTD